MIDFKTKLVRIGMLLGAAAVLAVLASPTHLHALNPGPMTPGHGPLACDACHAPAAGSFRQQVQANLRHLLGLRRHPVAFGFTAPEDAACLGCHQRPDDPHAIHRFAEPRFAEALKAVKADSCLGCHREHHGIRVSVGPDFCGACHTDLSVKDDPLDVSHRTLAAERRWSACLGCHDYHGNHVRHAQRRLHDAYDLQALKAYLASGPDPFGSGKRHEAPLVRNP